MIQIIIDVIALICFAISMFMGKQVDAWIVVVWILIALMSHIKDYKENKTIL